MSNWKANPVTGQLEMSFNGTLESIGENFLENSNGIKFKVGSVKLPNGKIRSARIYEKNLDYGMSVGTAYVCTATQYQDNFGKTQVDIKVSHLVGADRATLEDFGLEETPVSIEEQAI